jgi:F0F1-type ATP synthase assembly protein I
MDKAEMERAIWNDIVMCRKIKELEDERKQIRKDREFMHTINVATAWFLGVCLGVMMGYLLTKVF